MTVYLIVDYKGDIVGLFNSRKSKRYIITHHNGNYTVYTLTFLDKKAIKWIKGL